MFFSAKLSRHSIDELTELSNIGEVYRDRDSTILIQSFRELQSTLSDSGVEALTTELNERLENFEQSIGCFLPLDDAVIEPILLPDERMKVTENVVQGYALVEKMGAGFLLMNADMVSAYNPYQAGYGSLLKVEQAQAMYGRHLSFLEGRVAWATLEDLQARFTKVPTRGFWDNNHREAAMNAVLDVHQKKGSKLVAILYDPDVSRFDPHKIFEREIDYRWLEVPKEKVMQVIPASFSLQEDRPLVTVKSQAVSIRDYKGHLEVGDIVADSQAVATDGYIETIVDGLASAAVAEYEPGLLLESYANNTLLADQNTPLIRHPRFLKAIMRLKQEAFKVDAAKAVYARNFYAN